MGEHVGVVPGVVPDDHAVVRSGALLLEVRRQPGRRADHHGPVHPVGAGAERTTQAGGAELEASREAVGEVGGGRTPGLRLDLRRSASSSARVRGSGSSAAQARARSSRSVESVDAVMAEG